jgi:uncharacterized membrane protein
VTAKVDQQIAVAGCCLALGMLVPVALFQGEVSDSLPDPPGELWASERITLSRSAHPLGVPDSYLGLASYATTLGLLLAAEKNRSARQLLGAKLMLDAGLAVVNMARQVVSFRKLCSWCTGTALATGLIVYGGRAAMSETLRAVRRAV